MRKTRTIVVQQLLKALPTRHFVRTWSDNTTWVMPMDHASRNAETQQKVFAHLTAHGYQCRLVGTPGTSGEYTVEVTK